MMSRVTVAHKRAAWHKNLEKVTSFKHICCDKWEKKGKMKNPRRKSRGGAVVITITSQQGGWGFKSPAVWRVHVLPVGVLSRFSGLLPQPKDMRECKWLFVSLRCCDKPATRPGSNPVFTPRQAGMGSSRNPGDPGEATTANEMN